MTRVKRGTIAIKRRRKILRHTKGYLLRRRTKERAAKEALLHAWTYAFRDRRKKKSSARANWQVQINAAAREEGFSYSKFMHALKTAGIKLDRKVLSQIANQSPKTFSAILENVK